MNIDTETCDHQPTQIQSHKRLSEQTEVGLDVCLFVGWWLDVPNPITTEVLANKGRQSRGQYIVICRTDKGFIGCLLVACLTSQKHASVSQGRICSDKCTCCHTEIESCRSNVLPHPVTVYWHRADQIRTGCASFVSPMVFLVSSVFGSQTAVNGRLRTTSWTRQLYMQHVRTQKSTEILMSRICSEVFLCYHYYVCVFVCKVE